MPRPRRLRPQRKRKFFIPVSGTRTVFALGGPDGTLETFAFTTRGEAEQFIRSPVAQVVGLPDLGVYAVPGADLLGGILVKLPEQGIDILTLDCVQLPLTEQGAARLASPDARRPEWEVPTGVWEQAVLDGTWKRTMIMVLVELLGGDVSTLNWEERPEEAARKLNRLWGQFAGGYGTGKSSLPWEC
jgi:hypothetical protein